MLFFNNDYKLISHIPQIFYTPINYLNIPAALFYNMKLKRIQLNNIRSYEQETVEFSDGATLLSGDIGSGKTSILLGIEFALFGLQPGQRGTSLLRKGVEEGGVKLNFEVQGKEIEIERTLKKNKTVSQDYCAITIDGEKQEVSVTELKNKVLEILNYPKEFSKKQNLLYKFTVYTPQEEMKEIIIQDSKSRINTLRHVFGIDKYKRILENTSILLSKIREEKRHKEGQISNLEEDKQELKNKENQLEERRKNLESYEKQLEEKKELRKKAEEDKEEVNKKIEEKNKLNQEIEKTKIMTSNKQEKIADNKRTIKQLEEQINELKSIKFDESKITKNQEEISQSKQNKKQLEDRKLEISSKVSSLNMKNDENNKIKEKLKYIEVCPTCLQNVNWDYKNNVLKKMDENISQNNQEIEKLNKEKENTIKHIEKIEQDISRLEKEVQDLQLLKMKLKNLEEKENRKKEIERNNESLNKDIEMLKKHIESLKSSVLEYQKYDNLFEEKQKALKQAQDQEKSAEIKVAEIKREIELYKQQIEDTKKRIEKTEEIKKQLNHLNNLLNWVSANFVSLISSTERNVMTKLKKEFSRLFREWFSMLVPEEFNVRLDEEFTPVIEYQDYEIEYNYLSGGERTAVALAYRLALNQVINSLLSKIKTNDLVILDEPTDGFSDSQLDKMRNVLEELSVNQLIIVSHEQKIESFVDNVVRFKKENGISQKEMVKES